MPRKSASFVNKETADGGSIDRYFTQGSRKRKSLATVAAEEAPASQDEDSSPLPDPISKRRQQVGTENQWIPISEASGSSLVPACNVLVSPLTTLHLVPSQSSATHILQGDSSCVQSYRFQNYFPTPLSEVNSPLPSLPWGDPREVWQAMLNKESKYSRSQKLLAMHPDLQEHMRAVLLDWLIEVCEVSKLHRQTFYLSVDFVDRYLSVQKGVLKSQLQLIGITALFVAAKLEEIYPPKVTEFAYVTDGACSELDITEHELIMLKVLKWELNPVTVNNWIAAYMQLLQLKKVQFLADSAEAFHEDLAASSNEDQAAMHFLYPSFNGHFFMQLMRLTDLCMLDIECVKFSYSVIATSAIYHMSSEHAALEVSGYGWGDIAACVSWMAPFALAVRQKGVVRLKDFEDISTEDAHNIQAHSNDIALLDEVKRLRASADSSAARSSPDICCQLIPEGMLTPPPSQEKNSAVH